jgi:hypothetical protein
MPERSGYRVDFDILAVGNVVGCFHGGVLHRPIWGTLTVMYDNGIK